MITKFTNLNRKGIELEYDAEEDEARQTRD
jgi:hypothetical protein